MDARRRVLDDIAKLATSTAGLLQGAGREAEMLFRQRLDGVLDRMDLVPREEFDVVKAMAAEARAQNEALTARVAKLEAAIQAQKKPAPAKRSAKTSAAGKRTAAKSSTARAGSTARKSQKTAKK